MTDLVGTLGEHRLGERAGVTVVRFRRRGPFVFKEAPRRRPEGGNGTSPSPSPSPTPPSGPGSAAAGRRSPGSPSPSPVPLPLPLLSPHRDKGDQSQSPDPAAAAHVFAGDSAHAATHVLTSDGEVRPLGAGEEGGEEDGGPPTRHVATLRRQGWTSTTLWKGDRAAPKKIVIKTHYVMAAPMAGRDGAGLSGRSSPAPAPPASPTSPAVEKGPSEQGATGSSMHMG